MSELGTFLERFYGSELRFQSAVAIVRHTTHASRRSAGRRGRVIGRRNPSAATREEGDETLRIWVQLPTKARLETIRTREGRTETNVEVVTPDDAWTRHADGTVERGHRIRNRQRSELPTPIQRHFDRLFLRDCLAALTMEAIGTCQIANRDCVKVRAVPVEGKLLWPHWLPYDADEYILAADVERVALLSIIGIADGEAIESYEVEEVTFDGRIDDAVFAYEVKDDEHVRPATRSFERMSLTEAAARCRFTLLRPTDITGVSWNFDSVMYERSSSASPIESVTMHSGNTDGSETLWLTMRPRREERCTDLLWDTFEVAGQQLELSEPYPEEEGLRVLSLERFGTWVDICSDLPKDDLLRLALSLEPIEA